MHNMLERNHLQSEERWLETHLNETCMITFVVLAMFVFTAAILNYQRGPLDPSPSDRDRLEPSYLRKMFRKTVRKTWIGPCWLREGEKNLICLSLYLYVTQLYHNLLIDAVSISVIPVNFI